jgi:uncharacterized repeat protein (TIGR02543 family)
LLFTGSSTRLQASTRNGQAQGDFCFAGEIGMSERWLRCALGAALALTATSFLSCGQDHKLVAISIQPASFTFATPDPSAQGVFTAIGTYVHPPGTADITDKVAWKTDIPQLVALTGSVVSPQPNNVCGIADVSASLNSGGNFVAAYSTVTVNDPTRTTCPGGVATLAVVTVSLNGTGAGTVASVPAGINCPSQACGAQFTVGSAMVLNAVANTGHTFTGWTGCTLASGASCPIVVPAGVTTVTATFN